VVTEAVAEGKAGAGEGAGLVSVAAQCLVDLQTERGPATQSSGSNEDPAAAGGAGAGGSAGAATPTLTRYEYICNWTRPMKATLCQIEQGLKLWVVQENQYREKLTVHDKKNMDESDVRLCFSVSVISWCCYAVVGQILDMLLACLSSPFTRLNSTLCIVFAVDCDPGGEGRDRWLPGAHLLRAARVVSARRRGLHAQGYLHVRGAF
jgi:hypothetical protein